MALLTRRRVLAAKIETVSGTAESLGAADGAFNVEELKHNADIPMVRRMAQNSLSQLSAVAGARKGRISFKLPLCGSGAGATPVPGWADTFLPACGLVKTGNAFAPTSLVSNYKTLTMGLWIDGVMLGLVGAMGTLTLEGTHGEPAALRFEFQGAWITPTDVANPAPTLPTVIPPRFASATLTVGAYSPQISRLSLAANNEVYVVPAVGTASGYSRSVVVDRAWGGKMDPELAAVGTHDFFGSWINGTEAALAVTIGATAGNTIQIAAPKCQYSGVQEGERGKVATVDQDYQLNRNTAGDDEITITFA